MRHQNPEYYNDTEMAAPHPWPHADWPHINRGMPNDSEYAHTTSFYKECCNDDYPEDCVCVTSGDASRWNNLSALYPLLTVDFSAISGISAIDTHAIDTVLSAYEANASYWSSAQYIPNIYENLELVFSALNDKANRSEINNGIYVESEYFFGNGSENSVLRPSWLLKSAIESVALATNNFTVPLTNAVTSDKLKKDINELLNSDVAISASLEEAWEQIKLLARGNTTNWITVKDQTIDDVLEESKNNPNAFYYFTTTI